jgi:hypothetical protein
MKSSYLRPKDIPEALKKYYDYDISLDTVNRWRRRNPLPMPARLNELCRWFEKRIDEKRQCSRNRRRASETAKSR